jgi:predicted acyltransferase
LMVVLQTAYIFLMFLVTVPAYGRFKCGRGIITPECSTSSYLDRTILGPNQLYQRGPYDPEGLLSTLPSIGTSYIGLTFFYIAYHFRSNSFKRMTYFFSYGCFLVLSGMLVDHYWFRINKPIWSTSYMLFTGGLAGITLSLLSLITDEWGYSTIFQPFVWFGMNPLVMFFAPTALVVISSSWITWGKTNLRNWIYFTVFIGKLKLERKLASFLYSFVVELGWLAFAYLLYVKEIFIKL